MPCERWVAARLVCGLGNRLFQLAAAHTVSTEWTDSTLVFAMPYCLPSEHGDFDTIFKLFPTIEKVWKAEPLLSIEQDGCFKYTPFPTVSPADRVLLRGFWQSAEYVSDDFKPCWDSVDTKPLLERWSLTTDLQKQKTAFLHVRLGDYMILPHHQVNLLSYYVKAMANFPDDTRFLVFSDEIEKAKTLPVFHDRCVFVDEASELNTLYLMSSCHAGAITANSSFSWWGAFFGRQAAETLKVVSHRVYMPSPWMAQCDESTNPIYPPWATVISSVVPR